MESVDSTFDHADESGHSRPSAVSIANDLPADPASVGPLSILPADRELIAALCRDDRAVPFVLDTEGVRHLHFDLDFVQSCMRLDDPRALVMAYAQKMMAFLLFNRTPHRILLLGLGGGSLVKFCHHHLKASHLTVVEVNPDIIALRDCFHIPSDDDRLEIVLADGAHYIHSLNWTADVLLIDAFDESGIAPSLASDEFYARIFRCLEADGVLVMNMAGDVARFGQHLESLARVCPGSVLLVPVETDGNLLVFAFGRPGCQWASPSLEAVAQELQSELSLEFPRFLRRLRAGHLVRGAEGGM